MTRGRGARKIRCAPRFSAEPGAVSLWVDALDGATRVDAAFGYTHHGPVLDEIVAWARRGVAFRILVGSPDVRAEVDALGRLRELPSVQVRSVRDVDDDAFAPGLALIYRAHDATLLVGDVSPRDMSWDGAVEADGRRRVGHPPRVVIGGDAREGVLRGVAAVVEGAPPAPRTLSVVDLPRRRGAVVHAALAVLVDLSVAVVVDLVAALARPT